MILSGCFFAGMYDVKLSTRAFSAALPKYTFQFDPSNPVLTEAKKKRSRAQGNADISAFGKNTETFIFPNYLIITFILFSTLSQRTWYRVEGQ